MSGEVRSQRSPPGPTALLAGRPGQQRLYSLVDGPKTIAQLSTALGVSRQAVVRAAAPLIERGLLIRHETSLTKPRFVLLRADTCRDLVGVQVLPPVTADEKLILDLLSPNQLHKMVTVRNMANFGSSFGGRVRRLLSKGLIEIHRTPWGKCICLSALAADHESYQMSSVKAPRFQLSEVLSTEVKTLVLTLSALQPCRSLILSLVTDIRPSKGYTGRSTSQYLQQLRRIGIVEQIANDGHPVYRLTAAGQTAANALLPDTPDFDADACRQHAANAINSYRAEQRRIGVARSEGRLVRLG